MAPRCLRRERLSHYSEEFDKSKSNTEQETEDHQPGEVAKSQNQKVAHMIPEKQESGHKKAASTDDLKDTDYVFSTLFSELAHNTNT